MGLQGLHVSLSQQEPRELFDALYEEVYPEHDKNDEVDLVLAVKYTDGEEVGGDFDVVDYRVFRAGDEWFGDLEKDADGGINTIAALKEIDAWGRAVPGADGYFFIHKHPEGITFASPKDYHVNTVLSTIDFVRAEDSEEPGRRTRAYNLMIVVTQEWSQPIAPLDAPMPLYDRELDLAIHDRMVGDMRKKYDLDDGHPWVINAGQIREVVERMITAVETNDQATFEEIAETELRPLYTEMKRLSCELEGLDPEENERQIAREARRQLRMARGENDAMASLMEALDALIDEVGGAEGLGSSGSIELGPDGMVVHRDDKPTKPLAPPTEPEGERPAMPEIFMLPEIQDDGTGFNWVS